jgi:hypothetical protein
MCAKNKNKNAQQNNNTHKNHATFFSMREEKKLIPKYRWKIQKQKIQKAHCRRPEFWC